VRVQSLQVVAHQDPKVSLVLQLLHVEFGEPDEGNRRQAQTYNILTFSNIPGKGVDRCVLTGVRPHLFLMPSGRFLLPTSVAGFMQANSLKSGCLTSGSAQTTDKETL